MATAGRGETGHRGPGGEAVAGRGRDLLRPRRTPEVGSGDEADGLGQGLVLGVVGQEVEDLVVGEALAQQIGADADEEHDVLGRGFELELEESFFPGE